jgi:hypothetical protein
VKTTAESGQMLDLSAIKSATGIWQLMDAAHPGLITLRSEVKLKVRAPEAVVAMTVPGLPVP